jgi:crossover junction endodeoxyribonuclease RusA
MSSLEFDVVGVPRPQGSKSGFVRGGRVVMVEASKGLPLWRDLVVSAAKQRIEQTEFQLIDGPCILEAHFFLERPKSVTRLHPHTMPDLDKLLRAIGDALTIAGVFADDSRIIEINASKSFADQRPAGVHIHLKEK